jgi:hypothetical protein
MSQGFQFAKNRANKFGMVAQQVGYQVGDFFVQVQSGASALVAFGQQGTQLAGLLPGIYGAVVGIGLSLGTMLLKTFLDTRDAGKQLEESIKSVGEALSDLSSATSMLESTLGAPISAATERLQNYLLLLKKAKSQETFKEVSISFNQILKEIGKGAEKLEEGSFLQKFILGTKFGPSKEDLSNSKYLLQVQEELAEVIKGTEQQPRIVETSADIAALGDDLLAFAEKHGDVMKKRIEGILLETGLVQLMADELSTLAEDEAKAAEKSNDQIKATNANLDAQLELQMKQHAEQLKIDALRDKEHFRLDQELDHAKYLTKFQMNKKEIANSLANIARINYELSFKEKQLTSTEIADLMKKYDLLQEEKAENARLLELQKEKLKAQKELNKEVEKLAERLAIPFERALELIRQAKAEATVGLDAFGGPGSFKHGGIQTYKPESLKGGKGKEPTTMEGPIKALERQIELSKALFGLEGDARRRKEVFMQLEFQNRDLLKQYQEDPARLQAIADEVAAQEKVVRVLEEQREVQKEVADTIANSMGDALTSIVDGTKSVSDAFKDMARAIIAELYQIYVVKKITGMISSAIYGGLSGGTLAGGYSPGGKTYGSGAEINAMQLANGGAFYGGNVIPFANGGVVGHPTNFGMSGGRRGLMGEAGPEAIMPLKRGANGKLGVQAEGGAGDVIIHQNFNFQANGDDSVKKIIAQAAPQIAQMTKSSIISDRRRGGQMKATFG